MQQEQSVFNETDQHQIMEFCVKQDLDWKLFPARFPHFSGLWKASDC